MLNLYETLVDSPETPRTGELRERGEIRRLCILAAREAPDGQAHWVYEDAPARVIVKGYTRPFEGIARQLEPGSFTLELPQCRFPLTVEQVERVERTTQSATANGADPDAPPQDSGPSAGSSADGA